MDDGINPTMYGISATDQRDVVPTTTPVATSNKAIVQMELIESTETLSHQEDESLEFESRPVVKRSTKGLGRQVVELEFKKPPASPVSSTKGASHKSISFKEEGDTERPPVKVNAFSESISKSATMLNRSPSDNPDEVSVIDSSSRTKKDGEVTSNSHPFSMVES